MKPRQLAYNVLARFLGLLYLKTPARNASCSSSFSASMNYDDAGFGTNAGLLLRQQSFRILRDLFGLLGLRTPAQTDILRHLNNCGLLTNYNKSKVMKPTNNTSTKCACGPGFASGPEFALSLTFRPVYVSGSCKQFSVKCSLQELL
jgi:hypothetical protein